MGIFEDFGKKLDQATGGVQKLAEDAAAGAKKLAGDAAKQLEGRATSRLTEAFDKGTAFVAEKAAIAKLPGEFDLTKSKSLTKFANDSLAILGFKGKDTLANLNTLRSKTDPEASKLESLEKVTPDDIKMLVAAMKEKSDDSKVKSEKNKITSIISGLPTAIEAGMSELPKPALAPAPVSTPQPAFQGLGGSGG